MRCPALSRRPTLCRAPSLTPCPAHPPRSAAGDLAATNRSIVDLRASIKERSQLLAKVTTMQAGIDKSLVAVRKELLVNEQRAQDAQDMPTILDYISLMRTHSLLKREVAQAARKAEVAATQQQQQPQPSLAQHQHRSASAGSERRGVSRQGEDSMRTGSDALGGGGGGGGGGGNAALAASAALSATGIGKGPGSSCALPGLLGTRPMGTTASINRVLYNSVGTGAVAPATSALRRTMPAKTATETAEAMSGRALGGGGLVAPLMRSVTGGGPLPRGVAGFSGGMASSLSKLGGAAPPVLSKLHLGKSGIKGPPPRAAPAAEN